MSTPRRAAKRQAKSKALIPVLIGTDSKAVYFGWIQETDATKTTIRAERVRNCLYWQSTIGGVLGLARVGPDRNCRIGAEAPAVIIHGVIAVSEVTPGAAKAWTEAPCVS